MNYFSFLIQDCGNEFNSLTCYKKEMANACNNASDLGLGQVSYWNNSCTKVQDICSFYNMTHRPDQLDNQVHPTHGRQSFS